MATQRDMQRTPDDQPGAEDQREEDDLPVTGVGNGDDADLPGTDPDDDVPDEETPAEPSPGDATPDKRATQNRP
ncbi:hypothetical protein KZJ38_11500 [Paraburkholderia edwinii]|uniref:Uncharacterized protein n=1 Tax=Paraburkholderia edwinii TaxID=2861782 RepID=A0ABX8UEM3_9BURK|nr:hypothetical protein [Paraburkholderia edwinii]QYD67039.1 hypothetical protein KZJ38_11500 [Paraburkholderia edwinii]